VSVLQRHWDARAAANFMCGGAGSGLLVAIAFVPSTRPIAVVVALALIAAGLGAVWLEIGRKLRAIHVFFNPFTSWMTRESFAAALVFILGAAFLLFQAKILLYGAGVAAAAFLYCQARILQAAKGIPAWREPRIVPLIAWTGLAEGAGIALFFSAASVPLALFAGALMARLLAWWRYRDAVGSAALVPAGRALLWLGTILPLALLLLSDASAWAAPLGGIAGLAAGGWLKLALVTRASLKQDFSLPHLPVRGAR
jgi:phenylacetyl-CoA:acceptor oxidoreductase subunit 2